MSKELRYPRPHHAPTQVWHDGRRRQATLGVFWPPAPIPRETESLKYMQLEDGMQIAELTSPSLCWSQDCRGLKDIQDLRPAPMETESHRKYAAQFEDGMRGKSSTPAGLPSPLYVGLKIVAVVSVRHTRSPRVPAYKASPACDPCRKLPAASSHNSAEILPIHSAAAFVNASPPG